MLSRRAFVAGGLAAVAAACGGGSGEEGQPATTATPSPTARPTATHATPPTPVPIATPPALPPEHPARGEPFTLGVASGDPAPDGFVLWTRIAPDPTAGGGMPPEPVGVLWQVAEDEAFTRIVAAGEHVAVAEHAHSVHAVVTGLAPATTYWYRFLLGERTSPVGRTRTTPAAASSPDQLRLAFTSCQDYQAGYYAAWRHIAAEDVDLVVFLGDYIYGNAASPDAVRSHVGGEPTTLAEYRDRYALYRTDPDLAAAHAAHPWLITWDDHELTNDAAGRHTDTDGGARRHAAYQAWWEHVPVRLPAPPGPGEPYPIHRTVDWGDLARFAVLDTRQHRDAQACPDDRLTIPGVGSDLPIARACAELDDPTRTILGTDQRAWLRDELRGSVARWNLLAQQVLMVDLGSLPLLPERFVLVDTWAGYPAERAALLDELASVRNPVVLTGDFHSSAVNDLRRDPDSPVVATELMASAVSSRFPDGAGPLATAARIAHPDVRHFDTRRGYATCTLTADRADVRLEAIDDATDPASGTTTIARFTIDDGTPGARPQ